MAIEFHTGMVPGRIVWGSPARAQVKKDQQTKQPILRDGQPVQQWAFGVAFPKAHFEAVIWPVLGQEAATGYPNGTPRNFSFKYVDGDGVDNKGQPYSTREGYAGHYVLTVSTEAFAPPIFKRNPQGTFDQVPAEGIKTGDYVALGLNIKCNVPTNPTHTPGLYINPVGIELVAYGSEIHSVGQVDPNAMFGSAQYQLPAGASMTPMVQAGATTMPGMGQQPAMQQMQPAMGQQPAMQQMQPAMGQQPAMQQMQPAMGQQPAMQQMQPAMGQQPAMQQMQPAMGQQPGMMPAPAHDFVQNAGMQPAMGQQPAMQPGMMPGVQGMPGR